MSRKQLFQSGLTGMEEIVENNIGKTYETTTVKSLFRAVTLHYAI